MIGRHWPQALIKGDSHCRGQIQAADGPANRDVVNRRRKARLQFRWKAAGFRSEHQKQARQRGHGPEGTGPAFGKQADFLRPRFELFQKDIDMLPDLQPDPGPVVQSGAFKVPVVKREAQRATRTTWRSSGPLKVAMGVVDDDSFGGMAPSWVIGFQDSNSPRAFSVQSLDARRGTKGLGIHNQAWLTIGRKKR